MEPHVYTDESVKYDFDIVYVRAPRFRAKEGGVWEMKLTQPLADSPRGRIEVSVKDCQGNTTRIDRTFSVAR